jgi:hypothetical protein
MPHAFGYFDVRCSMFDVGRSTFFELRTDSFRVDNARDPMNDSSKNLCELGGLGANPLNSYRLDLGAETLDQNSSRQARKERQVRLE